MRVTGGSFRGRQLLGPADASLRPTQDRVRKSLFDLLGDDLAGFQVADLYAGTGSLGIECLSRGARRVLFVERDRGALDLLRKNLAALGLEGRGEVVAEDVTSWLARPPAAALDLILADPPYAAGTDEALAAAVLGGRWLAPGGLLALERRAGAAAVPLAPGFTLAASRRYGDTQVDVILHDPSPGGRT